MAQVTLSGVTKRYEGGAAAVSGVDLRIQAGEFVVLVGPSGCGKSTTLRMVAGLEDISDGTIAIDGRVVNDVPPKERDIAMVFQNYALYPHMTCFENMAFALRLKGTPRDEVKRRVEETAEVLGILPLLARRPKQLSGGQRQRVAVGRAMVRRPAVYLFDEPLSNLDARLRVEMRAELKRLHAHIQTTTLYVTHDQEEAMTLGDRVVVMGNGQVQQVGPPLEIYERPRNRFVAGFLGTPPMNFVAGRLDEGARFVGAGIEAGPFSTLRSEVGREVVLGLRPEDLTFGAEGPEARVEVVEPLGRLADVTLSTHNGERLVARVDAREAPRPRALVRLVVASERCHLFEPGPYGASLGHAEGSAS